MLRGTSALCVTLTKIRKTSRSRSSNQVPSQDGPSFRRANARSSHRCVENPENQKSSRSRKTHNQNYFELLSVEATRSRRSTLRVGAIDRSRATWQSARELLPKRSLFFALTPSLRRSKLFEPAVVVAERFSVHRITTSTRQHSSFFILKHSLIIRRLKNVSRIMRPLKLLFISISQPPSALRLYVAINNSELQPSRFSMSIVWSRELLHAALF